MGLAESQKQMDTGASPGFSPSTMSTGAGQEAITALHMVSSLPMSVLWSLPRAIIWTLQAGNSLLSSLSRAAGPVRSYLCCELLGKGHPSLTLAYATPQQR